MSGFFLCDVKGHLYRLPPIPFSCVALEACKSFTLSVLTEHVLEQDRAHLALQSMGDCNQQVPREEKKSISKNI